MLDEKGRCCGKKPHVYRSKWHIPGGPKRICFRCGNEYRLDRNELISTEAQRIADWKARDEKRKQYEAVHGPARVRRSVLVGNQSFDATNMTEEEIQQRTREIIASWRENQDERQLKLPFPEPDENRN